MTSGPAIIDISDTTAYGVQATRNATVITPNNTTILRSISKDFLVKRDDFPQVLFALLVELIISLQHLKYEKLIKLTGNTKQNNNMQTL